jgi:hypothetical protein
MADVWRIKPEALLGLTNHGAEGRLLHGKRFAQVVTARSGNLGCPAMTQVEWGDEESSSRCMVKELPSDP